MLEGIYFFILEGIFIGFWSGDLCAIFLGELFLQLLLALLYYKSSAELIK